MVNLYNNYDIVKITKPFTLQNGVSRTDFPANVEGVIVESFEKEYLVEFTYTDEETYYVLVKEPDMIRIFEPFNTKHGN